MRIVDRFRAAGRTRRRTRHWPLLLVPVLMNAGCSVRNDPHYNPYAPPNGNPPLLQSAQSGRDAVDDALDNLDQRIENGVY